MLKNIVSIKYFRRWKWNITIEPFLDGLFSKNCQQILGRCIKHSECEKGFGADESRRNGTSSRGLDFELVTNYKKKLLCNCDRFKDLTWTRLAWVGRRRLKNIIARVRSLTCSVNLNNNILFLLITMRRTREYKIVFRIL